MQLTIKSELITFFLQKCDGGGGGGGDPVYVSIDRLVLCPAVVWRSWGSGGAAKITHRHNLTSSEAALSIFLEENNTPWGKNMKCAGDDKQKCVYSLSIEKILFLRPNSLSCRKRILLFCFCALIWSWTFIFSSNLYFLQDWIDFSPFYSRDCIGVCLQSCDHLWTGW